MPEKSTSPTDVARPSKGRRAPWYGLFIALICVGILVFYWHRTRLPATVTIAGGPDGGRYATVAQALATELERRLGVNVVVQTTQGSLENLQALESGRVDLALYQSGTQEILQGEALRQSDPAHFVSNLYSEYLIPVGPVSDTVVNLAGSDGGRWSCNDRLSGDYAMAQLLMKHLGLAEANVEIKSVAYADLSQQIGDGKLDVGVICCGLNAPILRQVFASGSAQLMKIPAVGAFSHKHMILTPDKIPAGMFSTTPMIPVEDFSTVTVQAQLLAGRESPVRLIQEVATVVADVEFQRRLELIDLFDGGVDYATARPEFEIHPGASHVFFPELKPLVNPDFMEGTEGLRSFIVSLVAAVWLLRRWWLRRQIRSQEHRLDRYIRELLQLERDQMEVDGDGGPEESQTLQKMLDSVTLLRQEALAEFTAHELNEDNAVDCFIQMCHALSDKINAKLMRHSILNTK